MSWKEFTGKGIGYQINPRRSPSVTINPHGSISFNAATLDHFDGEEDGAVRFFLNDEAGLVGFEFLASREKLDDYSLAGRSSSFKAVLRWLELEPPIETVMIEVRKTSDTPHPHFPIEPVVLLQPEE